MSEIKTNLDSSIIETFLQGRDPQKYIVAVEAAYATNKIDLIINDPEKGKYIEESSYKPFLWCKEEVFSLIYDGKRTKIIEAQSFGVPVITANNSSLKEIVGDSAICVNAYNINEIKDNIKLLLENTDLYNKYKELGLENIKKFKWQKTAEETLRIFEKLK